MANSPDRDTGQNTDGLAGSGGASRPILSMRGIGKSFGRLRAVKGLDLDVWAGRVLALLGENGAGKTTAMNIVAGLYIPDTGYVEMGGKPLTLGSPHESIEAGIGMIHQQFKLAETLTGFENVSLAVDKGRFRQPRVRSEGLQELQQQLGFSLDLARPVWTLSIAERQQLAILRTLAVGAKLLILDEPTSVLAPTEVEGLYRIVSRIADSGRAVVLITHKLIEAADAADYIAVMRSGELVFTSDEPISDTRLLASHIIGEREIATGERVATDSGRTVLKVRDLSVKGDHGGVAVNSVTFDVHAGEVVALVGVSGNGQTEIMEAIGGIRPYSGSVDFHSDGPGRGFAFIPARHLGVGLASGLSIHENAILGHHRSHPFAWWLHPRHVRLYANRATESFGVDASAEGPVSRLSGGNLQRLVLGRELIGDPGLIVADYPTRGLDVASAAQVRSALVSRAVSGAGVLISSEEWEETVEIANRVLVTHGGRIVAELEPEDVDRHELGLLMTTGRKAEDGPGKGTS